MQFYSQHKVRGDVSKKQNRTHSHAKQTHLCFLELVVKLRRLALRARELAYDLLQVLRKALDLRLKSDAEGGVRPNNPDVR